MTNASSLQSLTVALGLMMSCHLDSNHPCHRLYKTACFPMTRKKTSSQSGSLGFQVKNLSKRTLLRQCKPVCKGIAISVHHKGEHRTSTIIILSRNSVERQSGSTYYSQGIKSKPWLPSWLVLDLQKDIETFSKPHFVHLLNESNFHICRIF